MPSGAALHKSESAERMQFNAKKFRFREAIQE